VICTSIRYSAIEDLHRSNLSFCSFLIKYKNCRVVVIVCPGAVAIGRPYLKRNLDVLGSSL